MSNDELIINTAIADGMPDDLAIIIAAQARHETGNYTSRFFTVGKNAFGYSYVPRAKWQLDKGGPIADNGIPIAQYATVQNSVHELTDWIKRRQREGNFPADLRTIKTPEQYAQLLKNNTYFTAPLNQYINGMVAALRTIGRELTTPTGAGIVLLIAVLAFAFRKKLFG